MDFLIIFKFISDYLWEYKILNAIFAFIMIIFSIVLIASRKIEFKVTKADLLLFFLFLITVFSYFRSQDFELATIDFLKILPLFSIYIVGRLWPNFININRIAFFSFICMVFFLSIAIFGMGYIYWGEVKTFTGGYYFKTDMALSVLIFLTFIISSDMRNIYKHISFLSAIIILFLCNSRVSIPLVFVLYVLNYYDMVSIYKKFYSKVIVFFVLFFIFILGLSYLDFSKLGMIGFDIKDPLSDSSSQGRNYIWGAMISYYQQLPILEKLFGAGLASDILASKSFYEIGQFDSSRAHNSYLWLLLCYGWIGMFLFIYFFAMIIKSIKKSVNNSKVNKKNLYVFTCLLIIFLVFSLTIEAIVRTQITFLLFLFAGLCCNKRLNNV